MRAPSAMPKLRQRAFTILELSIVIAVMALIMGGLVSVWDSNLTSKRKNEIKTKMDTIEAALVGFRKANGRLPCPAGLSDSVASANFGAEQRAYAATQNISGITNARPGVVTYAGADTYANGDRVVIAGVVGMTQVNNREFVVANVNTGAKTFELQGVNTTAFTAYASGGTIAEIDLAPLCIPDATAAGSCMGSTPKRCQLATDVAMGMVPTKALGLSDDMAFDPWGGRFDYVVDERLTLPDSFTTYGVADTTIGNIVVKDSSDTNITTKAVLMVLSHGPNGHGAYMRSGSRKALNFAYGMDTYELKNCHCNTAGADTSLDANFYQASFYSQNYYAGGGGWTGDRARFDDVTRYYLRSQLNTTAEITP